MSRRAIRIRVPVAVLPLTFLLIGALAGSLQAQEVKKYPEFRFDGQFRLRGEADRRTAGVDPDFATLSRIRAGVEASLTDWIRAYIQLQDARAWGSELNTLTDAGADNFDMHQGYAELGKTDAFATRLGRQEMPLADERLIGAVGWSNTGRSFDGVRMSGEADGFKWTAFWHNIAERDSLLVVGLHPQLNQGINDDGWLIGAFASRKFGNVTSELTALLDRDAVTDESYTVNLRLHGRSGNVIYEAAGAYQFGPDRGAWFASGKAGLAIGRGTVAAQLDYLSGDDDLDDDQTKAFNTLYGTNHKFYGYMDYFLAIPSQLDQAGLVDAILRGSLNTSDNTTVRLDLHRFLTAEERDGETGLGTELDLVGRWRFAAPGNLELGFGVFVPEELMSGLFPAFENGKKTTWWGYAQFILNWP
jgi:hypothetical protein